MEQRLCVFQQSDVISRYGFDQSLRGGQGAECYSEMVCIVQCVHEIFVERVNVLEAWEAIEDCLEFFGESLCSVLDFSCVKCCGTVRI